jgi:hypothetical protein
MSGQTGGRSPNSVTKAESDTQSDEMITEIVIMTITFSIADICLPNVELSSRHGDSSLSVQH